MKRIDENRTVHESKKDNWITLYPMRENEITQIYLKRIKQKLDVEYLEKTNSTSRRYIKIGITRMKNKQNIK